MLDITKPLRDLGHGRTIRGDWLKAGLLRVRGESRSTNLLNEKVALVGVRSVGYVVVVDARFY